MLSQSMFRIGSRQFSSSVKHHARVAIVGGGTAGTNVCAQLVNSGKV